MFALSTSEGSACPESKVHFYPSLFNTGRKLSSVTDSAVSLVDEAGDGMSVIVNIDRKYIYLFPVALLDRRRR